MKTKKDYPDILEELGAGGCMCDCKYSMNGSCDWDIEKRLKEENRIEYSV